MRNSTPNQNDKTTRKRLVVFGIDGATWEIIEQMVKQNRLPNFSKIMEGGCYGDLRSVNPPVTCPAWATMFTGKNPASLGVFHFFKPTAQYELKLSELNWRAWGPIWDIFSDLGKIVYVFNIPTTTAYKINGKFISGPIWGEQDALLAHPSELNENLKLENYQIRTEISDKVSGDDVYIEDITRVTENKFRIMYKSFKEDDWDLLIMGYYYLDQIQHRYWKYINEAHPKFEPNSRFRNVIFEHYELLDKYLGKVMDDLPENATLMVASDHGHEPTHTYVNLNAWLRSKGYLKMKDSELERWSEGGGIKKSNLMQLFYFFTQSYSKLVYFSKLRNQRTCKLLRNKFKDWSYVMENKFSVKYPINKYVSWENTQAYSMIFNTIFLNLEGREGKGRVNEKNYQEVRDKIVHHLKELTDPVRGKRVIKNIWTKEMLFPKKIPYDFPDIFIQFERGYRNYHSELHNPTEIFSKKFKGSTEHYLDGIFIAYGPDIEAGKKIDNTRLEDIVPTILHIFNYPIPTDIDGKVLLEIFREDAEPRRRAISRTEKSTEDSTKSKIRAVSFSKKI
jgi:predicted AlkP superfamily phosphohydrolase/phosphomutase